MIRWLQDSPRWRPAMWTEEHRRLYRREGEGYPSDLRDAEWARLAPLIPEASPGGRPRKTDMRAAMNAILYLLRTGCPYLPRDSFPPRSTVYNIFRKFQRDGVWEAIWAELHMALRERIGRRPALGGGSRQPINQIGRAAKTTKWVTTPASRSRAVKSTRWSTAKGCRCVSSFIPPRSRIATRPGWSSTRYAGASLARTDLG
jgi:putative transposase